LGQGNAARRRIAVGEHRDIVPQTRDQEENVNERSTSYEYAEAGAPASAISTTRLFGQVMFLVAVAIGLLSLGAYLGQDLSRGAAMACSFGGLGMLLAQSFGGERLRVGAFAIGWLYGLSALIGLGLGPAISSYIEFDPGAVAQAAGGTALIVVGMAAVGLLLSKDVSPWMKPLSIIVLIAVAISIGSLVFGGVGSLSPILSLLILAVSALLIMVDFNYLRKHGTEADTVWLATGIFVSIVNIFVSLLSLLSD
jgi:modulator of FtsH protease